MKTDRKDVSDVIVVVCELVRRKEHEAVMAERKRIAEKLEEEDFCVDKNMCEIASKDRCFRHIYEWLTPDETK